MNVHPAIFEKLIRLHNCPTNKFRPTAYHKFLKEWGFTRTEMDQLLIEIQNFIERTNYPEGLNEY